VSRGWAEAAAPVADVALRFGKETGSTGVSNISAAARIGDTLLLAGDEGAAIDLLTPAGEGWGNHKRIDLSDLLDLHDAGEEADLEGLATEDGWLWVLGSHARTRRKPKREEDEAIDTTRLADLKDTRPRCLLARLPLVEGGCGLWPVQRDGDRRAGMLKQSKSGNALAAALRKDELIGPFTRIPAKEGGVDMEGIAVCGDRISIGMRGPVIASNAVLLEMRVRATRSGKLKLDEPPVKRLLALEGLGIRDLHQSGDDLLILAGPTTGLDGPCALYRWAGWANDPPQHDRKVRLHRPERLIELPFGRGFDHPEGLALWDGGSSVLVVNDSPGERRVRDDGRTLVADVFALPGRAGL
jgi:hypothetical protein